MGACGCFERLKESLVCVHTERIESTSAEMVGSVSGL